MKEKYCAGCGVLVVNRAGTVYHESEMIGEHCICFSCLLQLVGQCAERLNDRAVKAEQPRNDGYTLED